MEQAHLSELLHDLVEVVRVFNFRVLANATKRKQPGGKFDHEPESSPSLFTFQPNPTTTSLQPNPTAACSHSAMLVIELPPARLEHSSLVFSEYTFF